MKNFKSLLILCSLLPVVYSCTSEDCYTDSLSSTYPDDIAFEQAKNAIFAMGLDTTNIVEQGDYYVVENDILINKDSCLSYSPKTRQFRSTYYAVNGETITIGVDNSITVSSGWIEAIKEVINIYNEYTGLCFSYVEDGSTPTICISKKDLRIYSHGDYICAQGEFPTPSRKPGANVYINTGFFKDIDSFLTHNQKIFLLMHEIGHNIGLRHTDCAINGEGVSDVGMEKIPGTPDTDSNSYMNSGTCGLTWTGMPQYDDAALKYLWPLQICTISFYGCNLKNITFNSKDGYIIDRTLLPEKPQGKYFAGWYFDYNLTTPYEYTKLTKSVMLYPKWRDYSNVTISTNSGHIGMPVSFNISETTEVAFVCTLYRGSNDWWSIYKVSDENNPVAVLSTFGGKPYVNQVLYMKEYIPINSQQEIVKASVRIVLSEGKYYLHTTFPEIGRGSNSATVYY